jgi:hypothetical protein
VLPPASPDIGQEATVVFLGGVGSLWGVLFGSEYSQAAE